MSSDEVFNVASGVETSLNDLARRYRVVMDVHRAARVRPGAEGDAVPRRLASTEKAERLLGFRASVSLDEGLRGLSRGGARNEVTGVSTVCAPRIPIARPVLGEPEAEAARRAILSGWVTQGPEVAAFEREFAAIVGAPHACAVSSCTTALHLALVALGVGPGDEVVTVSHSFIATANAIRYCGATPVFVDIELDTFNVDRDSARGRDQPADESHPGRAPARDAVRPPGDHEHRQSSRIPVIEDAACAIGSEIRWDGVWEPIGRPRGDIACFSFHPRKLLSTGDGGMLTTRDADLDRQFRLLRQHGMSVPDTVRHEASQVTFEEYPVVGFNYRMTDIQGAIGREQVKRLPALVSRRRELAARYQSGFRACAGMTTPPQPEWARSNWQSYAIRVAHGRQRAIMQALLDDGISTRRGVMNAHREAAYPAGTWRVAPGHVLDRSEEAQDTAIMLPLFHDLQERDQDRVIERRDQSRARNTRDLHRHAGVQRGRESQEPPRPHR